MHNPTEQQVRDWVTARAIADENQCEKLVLRHLTMESRPQGDVVEVPVLLDEGLPVKDADAIAREVVGAAQADANNIGGSVQMYALYAYYKKNPDYTPRKVFRISPESELDRDVAPSEPPTDKGLASQAMRHLEGVMRVSVQSQGYLFSLMERQLQRLQDKDERNGQQQVDMMLLVQEVLDGAHGRRLRERKEEATLNMREDALEYLESGRTDPPKPPGGQAALPREEQGLHAPGLPAREPSPRAAEVPPRRPGPRPDVRAG